MRICFVAEEFISVPSGRGRRIYETAKQLAKKHEVHIFCHRYPITPKESILDGIQVHRVGRVKSATSVLERILSSTLFLPSLLKNGRFDIINTNLLFPPVINYIAAKLTNTTIIFTCDDVQWHRTNELALAEYGEALTLFGCITEDMNINQKYDAYITVSKGVQKNLISMGVDPKKIFVVYNGVNLTFYDSIEIQERKNPTICYIGYLETRKNVLDLINAFVLVLQKIHNAQLIIVGAGPLLKKAKQTAKNLGVSGNTIFTGRLTLNEEVIKILKSSHALVLPSVVEGFGLVLAEANACRKPVVAYDVQCVREVIQDGVNGFLVQPKDLNMLAERIVTLLSNKKLRETMGNNGRKIVEEKFTWEKAAEATLKIYHQTLEKNCLHSNLIRQHNSLSLKKITEKADTYLEYLALKRYFRALKIKEKLVAKTILDIGCNIGYGTEMLGAIGIDIDRKMLLKAKRRGLEVIRCDANNLPFRPSTFDIVTCFEVIEHVKKPHQVLTEIFQVLKPEGTMMITTPNKNFLRIARLLARRKKPDFHVREYTFKQLGTMVKNANFVRIQTVGLGAWIPNCALKKFPELSEYLGKIGINYTFACSATKPCSNHCNI